MKNFRYWISKGIFLFIGLQLLFCGKPEIEKEIPLAKVGKYVITVPEFKLSYETSFSPLRQGVDPKRTYLDYMINELVLAAEGFKQGYNKSYYVKSRMSRKLYNNLLESFYITHVHNKVDIPEQEIQEATKKATVKFRMLIWPMPTLDGAKKAFQEASKTDLNDYVENQLKRKEIPLEQKSFYETDWVDYLGMPTETFALIQDLELHRPSEPIPWGDGWAIVQILGLQMKGITQDELKFGVQRKKIQKRLHNIKADEIVHQLMDSLITPMNVRVKGEIVEELAPALFQWIQDGLPATSLSATVKSVADTSKDYLKVIHKLSKKTLVTMNNGNKTVQDFLNYMNYYRKNLKQSQSYPDFKSRLITEIGTMVKNDVFISVSEKEGFADSFQVQEDLRVWEKKWTYNAYRLDLLDGIDVTDEEMKDYFKNRWRELDIADVDTTRFYKYKDEVYTALVHEKQRQKLEAEIEKLKAGYKIWINTAVLDTIQLDVSPKSQQISFFLRKSFTGRAITPTVDPQWVSQ